MVFDLSDFILIFILLSPFLIVLIYYLNVEIKARFYLNVLDRMSELRKKRK